MEEGEPILGGTQAMPGNTTTSNVGPQPINPAVPTASSTDFSSFQSGTQSSAPLVSTPFQSIPSARPQSVPRLTNRFSDRAALNQTPRTPIINNAPQNMQFVQPAPQVDSYASDIISNPTPTQPKKSKRWIAIVLVLLALTGIGVGAVMFVPTLLAGPVQEVTKEQYLELYDSQKVLGEMDKIIEAGINKELSIYELLLADYLAENDEVLNEIFLNKTNWGLRYDIPGILQNTHNSITKLEDTINPMSELNYPADIKEKIKKIHNNLPNYSAALNNLVDKLSNFRTAFINYDIEAIRKLIDNEDIVFYLSHEYADFFDIYTSWNQCAQGDDNTLCVESLDQEKVKSLTNDTKTVEAVFNAFLTEEDRSTIKDTSDNIQQLVDSIKVKEHEEDHEE